MKIKLLSKMGTKVSKITGRAGLKIKEKSPEILLVTGVVGFVATTVLACKATLGVEEILDEHKEMMEKIHEGEALESEKYPESEANKDKYIAFCKTGWKFVRLYSPAVAVGAISLTCILVSNNIRKKRYAAVVAAYTTVSTAFDKYRERVREDGGDELDRKYMFGTHTEQEEYTEVDEKGRKHKKKRDVEVLDDTNGPSGYARVFDSHNPNWSDNPSFNMSFLRAQQSLLNNKLQTAGHVFLNEVYEELGYEHTQEGAVVGWILDSKHDDYIDFGLFDLHKEPVRRFVNGETNIILLDFNVDGVIFDKI